MPKLGCSLLCVIWQLLRQKGVFFMVINKLLTTVNYKKSSSRKIKYIVVHYVGATGGAEANCKFFRSVYRGRSAHYFVGHQGEIWQSVEDKDIAWHCGSSEKINNTNSIGVEMCCKKKDGKWYFEEETVTATIELVKRLMVEYGISKENVVRHYDVTGKVCPEPYVRDVSAWNKFKERINMSKADNTPNQYAKESVNWAINNGILKGDENGNYRLHSAITRQDVLVFLHRALSIKK